MHSVVLWYFGLINLLTFILRGIDKHIAIKNGNRPLKKTIYRIPEKTLLRLVACGGSIGALVGMELFKHKRRKGTFLWKLLGLVFIHCIIFFIFLYR